VLFGRNRGFAFPLPGGTLLRPLLSIGWTADDVKSWLAAWTLIW
jgi:hypothetical protein